MRICGQSELDGSSGSEGAGCGFWDGGGVIIDGADEMFKRGGRDIPKGDDAGVVGADAVGCGVCVGFVVADAVGCDVCLGFVVAAVCMFFLFGRNNMPMPSIITIIAMTIEI